MLLNLQGWKSKMATTSIWAVKDNLDRVLIMLPILLRQKKRIVVMNMKDLKMLLIMPSMMIKLKDNFMSVV